MQGSIKLYIIYINYMDDVLRIEKHKNRYIISSAISAVVALGEFTFAILMDLHCLFSDACSNFIDTIMYVITIVSLTKSKKFQTNSTYTICGIQLLVGAGSFTLFLLGCVNIDKNPEWPVVLVGSSVSFLGSVTQTLILISTQKHGKTTKASYIFTIIGLLSAFSGMIAGAIMGILCHSSAVKENYRDIPDLIVAGIFSSYLIAEAIKLLVETRKKHINELVQIKNL